MGPSDQPTTVTPTERATLTALEETPRARVFDGEPLTIKLTLAAGERVPPHQHPDRDIVCHVLEGTLRLTLADTSYEIDAGDVIRFDGRQDISPEALIDSVALVVLAPR